MAGQQLSMEAAGGGNEEGTSQGEGGSSLRVDLSLQMNAAASGDGVAFSAVLSVTSLRPRSSADEGHRHFSISIRCIPATASTASPAHASPLPRARRSSTACATAGGTRAGRRPGLRFFGRGC